MGQEGQNRSAMNETQQMVSFADTNPNDQTDTC